MHYKIICRRGIAFILLLGFLSLSPIEARTVEWALPPTSPYYALQWVYPGLYEYNILDGKTRQFYRGFTDVESNNVIQGSYGGFYYAFLGNGIGFIIGDFNGICVGGVCRLLQIPVAENIRDISLGA